MTDSQPPIQTEAQSWILASDRLPTHGLKVLGFWRNELGKGRRTCCEYVVARTRDADGFDQETPDDWFDVDESGESWVPEGWYEISETVEDRMYFDIPVTHWMPLPEMPR